MTDKVRLEISNDQAGMIDRLLGKNVGGHLVFEFNSPQTFITVSVDVHCHHAETETRPMEEIK